MTDWRSLAAAMTDDLLAAGDLTDSAWQRVPVAGNSANPLLILDKTAPDEVTGYFDNANIGFMPLRHDVDDPFGPPDPVIAR